MKLFYQFCNCSNKKIETRKLCEAIKAKILICVYLFTTIFDISVLIFVTNSYAKISGATCKHTKEYEQVHSSCKNSKRNINHAAELARFPSSPSISQHVNEITKELQELLQQQNHLFRTLKEHQRTCVTNFIQNEIKEKAEFFYKLIGLNLVTFIIAVIWMCKPIGLGYGWNDPLPDAVAWSLFILMSTMMFKLLSLIAAIFGSFDFLKIDDVENFLLNC